MEYFAKRIAEIRTVAGAALTVVQKPSEKTEMSLPGSWLEAYDEERFDFYEFLNMLMWTIAPPLVSGMRIGFAIAMIWLFALLLYVIIVTFSLAVPASFVWVLTSLFGMGGAFKLAVLFVLVLLVFVIVVKLIVSYLWVYTVEFLLMAVESKYPQFLASIRKYNAQLLSDLQHRNLLGLIYPPKMVVGYINGEEILWDELPALVQGLTSTIEVFSILSFMKYAPKPFSFVRELISVIIILLVWNFHLWVWVIKTFTKRGVFMIKCALILTMITLTTDFAITSWLWSVTKFSMYTTWSVLKIFRYNKSWKNFKAFCRLWFLVICLRVYILFCSAKLLVHRHRGNGKSFNKSLSRFRAVYNQTLMDFGHAIDSMALPDFIRTFRDNIDAESIQESQDLLSTLGWPTSVNVTAPDFSSEKWGEYRKYALASFDFEAGIPRARFYVEKELQSLRELAPMYMHSFQYATWQNELDTTARYFTEQDYKYPDLGVDEAWQLLWPIFKDSKLTPFSYIVSRWEKRYGLGPFWRDFDKKRPRKLPRFKAIKMMGGFANFVKTWAKTFYYSPAIVPTAGVSVKSEALPPKKWMADRLRTIISAPLSHYILSTVFNYGPNHNFKYWYTPIKVGLPLNGINLSKLFEQHASYSNHFAGDFSQFDSTVQQKVLDLVKAIRKKGFEAHRDYKKICHLIDINYKGLFNNSPLAFTSTGKIYDKKTGLSTGHSSTSMDNSVAIVVIYLMLWKDITGLSAHQFRHFNKLSCYGDDHILSFLSTAPTAWTKFNFIKTCAKWGLSLRDEAPKARGLDGIEFLSKFARQPTTTDRQEMEAAGVPVPTLVVAHNPAKLIGKATAPIKNAAWEYRLKRVISYLDLCAHHKDIYTELATHARFLNGKVKQKRVVPTYEDILRKWYDPKTVQKIDDESFETPPEHDDNVILSYGNESLIDQMFHALSIIPDLLNPVIYNQGYVDWAISRLGRRLSWPIHLIRVANDCTSVAHVQAIGRRTPYEWLVVNQHVYKYGLNISPGGLLLRHWLYVAFKWPDALTPRYVVMLRSLTKKLSDFAFVLNGKVWVDTYRAGVPMWDIGLVFLLSFLPDFPLLTYLFYIDLPNPLSIMEMVYQSIIAKIWHSVPPNFKELHTHLVQFMEQPFPMLVEAPTGTGKSTTMIKYFMDHMSGRFEKFIVVSPRAIIAENTAPYMCNSYGVDACAVTASSPFVVAHKLMYVTPVELLLHHGWATNNSLVIIDECHLNEVLVVSIITWCKRLAIPFIMTTATPSKANIDLADRHINLRMANVWTKTEVHSETYVPDQEQRLISQSEWFADYTRFVMNILQVNPPMTRFLIFVPAVHQCQLLADRIGRRTCILNSSNKLVDEKASVYIATAVADVGLTLPSIDWMISSNVTKTTVPKGESVKVTSVLADTALLRQRAGRVGRTSNGFYSFFMLDPGKGCPAWIETDPPTTLTRVGEQLIRAGVPITQIAIIVPEFLANVFGKDPKDRTHEPLYDSFCENVKNWQGFNDFHQWKSISSYSKAVVSTTHEDSPDVEGVFVADAPEVLYGGGPVAGIDTKPLTLDEWTNFIIYASKEGAERDFVMKATDVSRFIKNHPINGEIFLRKLRNLGGMEAVEPYYWGTTSSGTVDGPYVSALDAEGTKRRWTGDQEDKDYAFFGGIYNLDKKSEPKPKIKKAGPLDGFFGKKTKPKGG
ncbi:replicase [Agaricus bisporus virus 11]|uniref:Replicase n=1 Tax=Agaricus bisporus virus 11 TaxID=1945741 RepID=A0AAC9M4Q6_9VIRU|nr:replicase [Agaricus bisporus virus 11]AQM49938.1 replicase [Agaricus bisporus virus 11]